MASLIKSGKKYYVQFFDKNKSPQRKQIATGTNSKAVANSVLKKLEAEYILKNFDPWENQNHEIDPTDKIEYLNQLFDSYIGHKSKYDWRPNTIITNKNMLRLASDLIGSIYISDTTEDHFNNFINHGNKAQSTRLGYRSRLIAFINWSHENGYLSSIKTNKLKIHHAVTPQSNSINYFSSQDIIRLKTFIHQKVEKDLEVGTQTLSRNALWLIDFIDWQRISGLRLSETLNLRVNDINFDTWEITIGNSYFKTKSNKKQILPIYEVQPLKTILTRLAKKCNSDNDRIFRHTSRRHAHRLFKSYLRKALPEKSYLNIHSLRHTCCIELLKAGTSIYTVQRWLRHADVKTTQKYADILNVDLSKEIGSVFNSSTKV